MIKIVRYALFAMLAFAEVLIAQQSAFGQIDSLLLPSNAISTGHSYFGVEAGISESDYLGGNNFLWGIVTSINPTYHAPEIATYVPFNHLGTGTGFVGGVLLGIALSPAVDLEAKARFLTNYTSQQESHTGISLDPFVPTVMANGNSNYSLQLSSLDFALLGHLRITDYYYVAGGFSASQLIKNGLSVSQHLTTGDYIDLIVHSRTTITDQNTPKKQLDNWFYGFRADAQIGVGSVFRIGANNMLLDAELLVSIPFTQWLTKAADSSLNGTAKFWFPSSPPAITDPHLWYATLTVGLRLPFHQLPPPIPEPIALRTQLAKPETLHITPVPIMENNGGIILSGKVTDAASGKPIVATLTTVDLSNNQIIGTAQTDSNGNYNVSVTGHPGKYSVTANANGYLFGTAYFEVDSAGRILKNGQEILLSNASSGKTRLLVFFDFDQADLQPASSPELNRAVELMKAVPTMNVEIAGYSDSIGTRAHNMDLSLRRATAVRDFLIQNGIAAGRIAARGYGSDSPIATNATEEGRAENRRVEFVVEKH